MGMSKAMRQMPGQPGRAGEAHGEAGREAASDEASGPPREHPGTGSAKPKVGSGTLLEAALTRENLQAAWKRVKANKGAAGVDGLDIERTAQLLRTTWSQTRQMLLAGTYRPQPVRRVMIPKPDGSQRELGIPTVLDRLIQQALLQVLQPLIDPTFSEHSHGFRPGRRAHDAVKAARAYVQTGKRVVVDVDLAKFFDRVNHDILIDRLGKRIDDAGVLRLVRAYLNAGIMDGGVVVERHLGTPQGGPLSPLLANVLLDEVDKALEARGYSFARYADDCNVYVGSLKAGQRVMALLRKLYARLKLQINEAKSAVGSVFGRKFLGYALWVAKGREVKCAVAQGHGPLQGPHPATHTPLGRVQHGASGAAAAAVPAGLEGVLRAGANAQGLARAGRVAASPLEGNPAQALETADDDLPRTPGAWRRADSCQTGGGQQPPLVAQQ